MDAPGRNARKAQLRLEGAQHPLRAAHEDREPLPLAVDGGEDLLGREATFDARVDQVRAQRLVAVGDLADLGRERRLAVGGVEEVDTMGEIPIKRSEPAQEGRDADASRDPDLPAGSLPMAEAPMWPSDHRRHPRLDELVQP